MRILQKNGLANCFDTVLATTDSSKENMIQELLKKFEKTPANIRGETAIHKLGIHIACLLRYHIALERKSIRSAKRELKRGEKRELADRIARVLKLLL